MWRGCFPASPKSFPTHQTPSAFHSAALKILSSSALCLKETPEKCVCVSECARADERALHVAALRHVFTLLVALSNHERLSALPPVSWPLGGRSGMNSGPS